jgi:hypothetical protein
MIFKPAEVGWRLGRAEEPRTTGVIGPQGSGKTLDLLAPALLQAPGAALVTLTKVDDLLLSLAERSRDRRPCIVLDPFGLAAGTRLAGRGQLSRRIRQAELRSWIRPLGVVWSAGSCKIKHLARGTLFFQPIDPGTPYTVDRPLRIITPNRRANSGSKSVKSGQPKSPERGSIWRNFGHLAAETMGRLSPVRLASSRPAALSGSRPQR